MKIVIDIPKEIYEELKSYYKNITLGLITHEAIANGTPLPKGHGRLIDADKIIKYWKPDHNKQFDADYFIHTLEVADTIIEAEGSKHE